MTQAACEPTVSCVPAVSEPIETPATGSSRGRSADSPATLHREIPAQISVSNLRSRRSNDPAGSCRRLE